MLPLPPRPTLFPYTTLFRSSSFPQQRLGKTIPAAGTNLIEVSHARIEFAMANGRASTVLHYIRRLVAAPHAGARSDGDRKSTRLNSSHLGISYAVFCLKKKI